MVAHVVHKRSFAACSLFVLFASTANISTLYGADDMDGKRKLLTFIKESYQANLDSFEFCTCKFMHIKAAADSMESALKGQVKNPIIRDGIWTFKGQKIMHDLKCRKPFDPKVTPPKPGIMALECGSHGYLTNGSIVLSYSPEASIANIWPPENSIHALDIYWTPFTVGIMGSNGSSNPARLIEQALRGKFDWDVTQPTAGKLDSRVSFVFGKPGQPKTSRIEVNVEKGCLPEFKTACYPQTTNRGYEMRTTDILSCSKGRWFPKRTVIIWDPDVKQTSYQVDIVDVTKLDVDSPPLDNEFVLQLAPRVQVSEARAKDSLYWTKNSESISVDDLEKVLNRCRARATRVEMMQHPQPRHGHSWLLITLFLLGILCFLYGYRKIKGSLVITRRYK